MKKDFLVLTSTLGGKDKLVDPTYKFDSCDYVAIVDKNHDVSVWDQYDFYNFSSIDGYPHRRNAKLYKVLSTLLFSNYKYIIWHDGNWELTTDPVDIIEEYGDADLYLLDHPIRNCIYKEMDIIKNMGIDTQYNINKQNEYYKSQHFPKDYGLYAMGNFIKKLSPKMTTLELKWWEHITKYSSRDQCSFMYCVWDMEKNKTPIDILTLKGDLGNNKYFRSRNQYRLK